MRALVLLNARHNGIREGALREQVKGEPGGRFESDKDPIAGRTAALEVASILRPDKELFDLVFAQESLFRLKRP